MIHAAEASADQAAEHATDTRPTREQRSARWAAWAFAAYTAAGLPLLVLVIGKYWWFFRDDWFFITDRDLSYHGLMDDHNGHWTFAPVIAFRALWFVFGLHSYAPYKVTVVVLHLVVVVCVRVIMRRYGVGPWLATVLAASLVLFGSGREDILWAFQIGFTGSIAMLLVQWCLTDREGAPVGRRDALGVACGVIAVGSASPALPLLAALAVTLLVRRGWRAAMANAVPVAGAYLMWSLVASPDRTALYGRAPAKALIDWVQHGVVSTFDDLTGGHRWASIALGVVVVAGTALVLARPGRPDPQHEALRSSVPTVVRLAAAARWRLRPVIGPIALFGATVLFIMLAAQRAWYFGPEAASASRYIYACAAFTLPLIALSIQEIARRSHPAAALLAVFVVIGVPSNVNRFQDEAEFGPLHHAHQRDLLLNVTRSPAVAHAPDYLRPDPDGFNPPGLTVGFLRRAEAEGKLPRITSPIPRGIDEELIVRLGLRQEPTKQTPPGCHDITTTRWQPEAGTIVYLEEPVNVRVQGHGGSFFPIMLQPFHGKKFTVVAPDLDLEVAAVDGGPATICVVG